MIVMKGVKSFVIERERDKMTNFEKIKSLDINELAEKLNESFACDHCPLGEFCSENSSELTSSCTGVWKEWLKSEVEE